MQTHEIFPGSLAIHGLQRIRGPHCISLLAHAKAGGDASPPVFEYLQSVGNADAEQSAPPSVSDASALRGTYAFGSASNRQIDVTWGHGKPTWARRGMMGRSLHHVGDHVFHPAAAPTAHIRCHVEGTAMVMTVENPDQVLVARPKPPARANRRFAASVELELSPSLLWGQSRRVGSVFW